MRYGLAPGSVLDPYDKGAVDYFDKSLRLIELAERPGCERVQVVQQLVDDGTGHCRSCSTRGQPGRDRYPCSIRSNLDDARRRLADRAPR